MKIDIKRNKKSSRSAWTVLHMDEPEAKGREKKEAEGKAKERKGEKQSKGSKGSEGFGLVDS